MSDWIPLNQTTPEEARKEVFGGIEAEIHTSPMDLPIAGRVTIDSDLNMVVLELRYLADENTEELPEKEGYSVTLGKRSGRLHRLAAQLETDPSDLDPAELSELLNGYLDLLSSGARSERHRNRWVRRENVRVTREAVERDKERLFTGAAAAFAS